MRVSVEPESSAQTEENPYATAITGAPIGIDAVVRRLTRSTLITRACSLQATQAVVPWTASVIVGQYGPAAAQTFTRRRPGQARVGGRLAAGHAEDERRHDREAHLAHDARH